MDFAANDTVVCIDTRPRPVAVDDVLVEGQKYKVARVVISPTAGVGVELRGVPNSPGYSGFFADRFRLAEDDDAALGVFRKILVDA